MATYPRGDAGDELRVSIDELGGRRFLTARIWECSGSDGSFWPSKRGITIRAHELEDFAKAVGVALERMSVAKEA